MLGEWTKKAEDISKAHLIREVLDLKTDLNTERKNNYYTLSIWQETMKLIKTKMNKIRDAEIQRILKEILTNDYLRRFGVTQNKLFAAICGEDQANVRVTQLKLEYQVRINCLF